MNVERATCIDSGGRRLVGVLHVPAQITTGVGVVVVVGGPQYRVGSHRQFVLVARDLCRSGVPVLRFDVSGMGDSEGRFRGFESLDEDIRAAIDHLQALQPGVRQVCLWGLCDGASAALMYAAGDARVSRLILLNPWVRTTEGQAQAYLDNYYGRRLRDRRLWTKVLRDPRVLLRAVAGYVSNLYVASTKVAQPAGIDGSAPAFLDRMLRGALAFRGHTLILLSGQDLVATEFESMLGRFQEWRRAFSGPGVSINRLPDATHTFARREWRDWVMQHSARFLST